MYSKFEERVSWWVASAPGISSFVQDSMTLNSKWQHLEIWSTLCCIDRFWITRNFRFPLNVVYLSYIYLCLEFLILFSFSTNLISSYSSSLLLLCIQTKTRTKIKSNQIEFSAPVFHWMGILQTSPPTSARPPPSLAATLPLFTAKSLTPSAIARWFLKCNLPRVRLSDPFFLPDSLGSRFCRFPGFPDLHVPRPQHLFLFICEAKFYLLLGLAEANRNQSENCKQTGRWKSGVNILFCIKSNNFRLKQIKSFQLKPRENTKFFEKPTFSHSPKWNRK